MPTQDQIVKARENRVWNGYRERTGTIIKGDLYCDRVTVHWDAKGNTTEVWTASLNSVYGQPTWIGEEAHYPDGSVVTAGGEIHPFEIISQDRLMEPLADQF